MPYSLNFSDPGNLNTITVPDYPPGINAVDTSLSLVGKAYPNYGQVMDQNLLKLLENFASPNAPYFPIKGQLWYDSYSQSLKLFDGNVWKSSNGIYQQAADPSVASSVSTGDIWVDTTTASLKIRSSGAWIKVGPTVTTSTGINVETLSVGATTKTVLSVYVNGTVVAIFNNDTAFTPTTIPGNLQGFTEIGKGITLPESSPNAYTLKGTADNASKLGGVSSDSYLRKNDSSAGGQIITGKVVYETSALSGGENRDGVIIRTAGENPSLNYIQFFKKGNDAVVSNEVKAGKIIFKVKGVNDTVQTEALTIEKNKVTIQGNVNLTTGTFTATSIRVTSTLNAVSSQTGAVVIDGGLGVAQDIHFGGNLYQRGILFDPVGLGTVLTVSIASANGLAGTVTTPTTTPVVTLRTTVSGMLKGNGTAISAAVAGTDYQAPLTLTTVGSSGAATLVGSTLNIPQYSGGGGGGSVTTVSVASANGFAGTVANASSTPAITLTTTITGLIKGNGTAMSAAVAGTDYQVPITASGVLKGNGTAVSAAVAGTDYQAPLSLTTLGTSGAATLVGNTLNIPQYTGGGGGGGAASRSTVVGTTGSLANGATGNLNITGFKGYALYKIQTSAAAWVRLYTTDAARTADAGRTQGTDPSPGAGVIAEVITTGAQSVVMSPGVMGFNDESSPTTNIAVAVTNNSGGAAAITVTLTVLQLEA